MLPGFVWKKLSGEKVNWSHDYATVDEAEVIGIHTYNAVLNGSLFAVYLIIIILKECCLAWSRLK